MIMFENLKGRCVPLTLTFLAGLFPALVFGQSLTVETVNTSTSATSVDVTWTLEPGASLQGFQFLISYDNASFSPNLDNCLSGEDADNAACFVDETGASDRVSIGLLNFSSAFETTQTGTITFAITGGTAAGDYPLAVEEFVPNTVPEGASVTLVDGEIQLRDIAPALTLDPTSLTFSAANGSTSPAQTVTATNTGNLDGLIISGASFGGAGFDATDNCPSAEPGLAQGASCTFNITFSPDAIGDFSTTFDVTSNGGAGQVAITATATAGPAPSLTIAPTSFDFGELLTGVESAETTFTVSNQGETGSTVSLDSVGFGVMMVGLINTFEVTGGTCAAGETALTAGASCTVIVTFTPSVDGPAAATLTVEGTDTINDSSVSVSADLTGEGVTRSIFSSDPAPGDVNLGFAGAEGALSLDVLVNNDGNGSLSLDCTETSDPGDVFSFSEIGRPADPDGRGEMPLPSGFVLNIDPDSSDSFNVSCNLPDLNSYSATLSCATNDPDNLEVEYTFSCSGLEPLAVPTMSNWSIALFALIMLLVGGFSIRFFRT
jgi:hypothetical protein